MSRSRLREQLRTLLRIRGSSERLSVLHATLSHPDWPDLVFASHDDEEIGPRMLARIVKKSGLTPDDP